MDSTYSFYLLMNRFSQNRQKTIPDTPRVLKIFGAALLVGCFAYHL